MVPDFSGLRPTEEALRRWEESAKGKGNGRGHLRGVACYAAIDQRQFSLARPRDPQWFFRATRKEISWTFHCGAAYRRTPQAAQSVICFFQRLGFSSGHRLLQLLHFTNPGSFHSREDERLPPPGDHKHSEKALLHPTPNPGRYARFGRTEAGLTELYCKRLRSEQSGLVRETQEFPG